MDLTQLSQMVSWLDEEHRHDREELAKLDQRLQSLGVENQQQARRIQELEGRLASTAAQLTRFTQLEQALQQLKTEMVVMLDKQTEARMQTERELERSRMSDRENASRGIAEVRKELTRFSHFEEELNTRQAEDQRLSEMTLALRQSINGISKDLDDRTRSLPYMVEQRAQDNRRIAQIQSETVELLKRTDALASKLPVFDEYLQRLDRELQRILPVPDILREEQHTFIEAQKIGEVERTRQMVQWSEEFVQQRAQIEKHSIRLRDFAAQYEAAGRAIKTLEEFQVQITREQKQVAELQRLAEERQRKELAEWQGENEQRWKKELLRWDYNLQEQQKINQKLAEQFPPLVRDAAHIKREIEAVWRLQELLGERQMGEAQRLLDTLSGAIESRPRPE